MPATYSLITSTTLGASASSVTFSGIPATYTDLVVRASVRSNPAQISDVLLFEMNGLSTAIYTSTIIYWNGGAGTLRSSNNSAMRAVYYTNAANSTTSTFANIEIYIPNYQVAFNKQVLGWGGMENQGASIDMGVVGSRIGSTAALTSIRLFNLTGPDFVANSKFYLYGISSS